MIKKFVVQIPKEDTPLRTTFLEALRKAQTDKIGTIDKLIDYLDGRGLKYDLYFEATEDTENDWGE